MHDSFKKTFKDRVAEEAKKVVKKVFRDEVVAAKCSKSILMHNTDKWVASDQTMQGYSLPGAGHSGRAVIVWQYDKFGGLLCIGGVQEGRMPSSVYLSFACVQQKSGFFLIMANRIISGNKASWSIKVLASRDAFSKDLIPEAMRLTQKVMSLRMNGEVASFRLVARDWDRHVK
jgi:hypothetical protein